MTAIKPEQQQRRKQRRKQRDPDAADGSGGGSGSEESEDEEAEAGAAGGEDDDDDANTSTSMRVWWAFCQLLQERYVERAPPANLPPLPAASRAPSKAKKTAAKPGERCVLACVGVDGACVVVGVDGACVVL
jgi:hypothetical protein